MIDKYNNLAREALSNGDKILSENYFQYADHFTRILSEQEAYKKNKFTVNAAANVNLDDKKEKKSESVTDLEKSEKTQSEVN